MTEEVSDFIAALAAYVNAAIADSGQPADYCMEALKVVDARGHLFRPVGIHPTDEAEDIYALRDLCRVDEETMNFRPDRGRMLAVARNFFSF